LREIRKLAGVKKLAETSSSSSLAAENYDGKVPLNEFSLISIRFTLAGRELKTRLALNLMRL
jgi:hypothetical protein